MPLIGTLSAKKPGRVGGPVFLVLACLLTPAPAAAQLRGSFADEVPGTTLPRPGEREPGYRVKPVEGAPTAAGVRRVIETFLTWTLICDEEKRRRVCNASQSIVAADGGLAFSWSLAATRGGEPVFVVRAPVAGFPSHTLTLDFGAGETVIRLPDCDASLCVGFLPLDETIVKQIRARRPVGIRYRVRDGAPPVTITASLDGLGAAIGSIR